MGDRANIYLVDREDSARGIYLYTHWSGYEWPEKLRVALAADRERWDDPAYLSRFIASSVFNDIHGEPTGGGISTFMPDNEHPIVVVDMPAQRVHFAPEPATDRDTWDEGKSFDDYAAQSVAVYPGDPS